MAQFQHQGYICPKDSFLNFQSGSSFEIRLWFYRNHVISFHQNERGCLLGLCWPNAASWPIFLISTPQHVFIQSRSRTPSIFRVSNATDRPWWRSGAVEKRKKCKIRDGENDVRRVKRAKPKFRALSNIRTANGIGRFIRRSVGHCVTDPGNFVANFVTNFIANLAGF